MIQVPYVIRKKIKLLCDDPLFLKVDLADEKLWQHYNLHHGYAKCIRGTASLLANENNYVECVVDRDYEFQLDRRGRYVDSGSKAVYDIWLMLPQDLVSDFAIDANKGIELVLNEVVYGTESQVADVKKIFSERMEQGSMDFELKGVNNEVLPSSELLVTTKFADEFYDKLAFEINSAFRIRLFTATMVLVRKLFENLVIEVLRQKYGTGMPQIGLFYSIKNNGFHSISVLIKNLRSKTDDFKPYGFFNLVKEKEDFLKFLWSIKEEGNASAHSIELILNREKISALKVSSNTYSSLLVRLIQKIKETPK